MKHLFFLTLIFALSVNYLCAVNLDTIRENYVKAVTDKNSCKEMIDKLANQQSNMVDKAYLGAFETIWAKYTLNPLSKLKTFNKGKDKINAACEADPNNVEIRFIRLSIQKNCPYFLGYRDNITEDEAFLEQHAKTITSPILKEMVDKLLENNK